MSSVTTTPSIAPMGSIDWDSRACGIVSVIYQVSGKLPSVPLPEGHVACLPEVVLFSSDSTKMSQVLAHLSIHIGSRTQLEVRSMCGDFSATGYSVGYYNNPLMRDSAEGLKYVLAQLSQPPHYMGVSQPQILATVLPDIPLKHTRGLLARTQMSMSLTGVIVDATLAFKTIDGKLINNQASLDAYIAMKSGPTMLVTPVPAAALLSPPPASIVTAVPAAPKKKVWRSPFASVDEASGGGGGGGGPIRNLDADLALAAATPKLPLAPKKMARPISLFDMSGAMELMNITSALEAAGGGGGGGGGGCTESVCSHIDNHSQHELEIPEGHAMCITDGCTEFFAEQEGIKRCLDCRKNRTRFIRPCKKEGCSEFAYTSQEQMMAGKSKYGDDYQPYSRCFMHAKERHDTAASEASAQEFVTEDACATEECEGLVQLTAKEVAFFESKGLELPTRCKECRAERKEAKKSMVECECEACEETFSIPEGLKLSLEEQGKQLTCYPCRSTTTRNCKHCSSGFLTLAQIAWSKAQFKAEGGEWRPPNYCSKECKATAIAEVAHTEGASRGGKRAAK